MTTSAAFSVVSTAEALRDRLLPSHRVAKRLGVTDRTVRRWCENGDCPATMIGCRWRVPESWVNEQITRRGVIRRRHEEG